jgi:hypothetical protein
MHDTVRPDLWPTIPDHLVRSGPTCSRFIQVIPLFRKVFTFFLL